MQRRIAVFVEQGFRPTLSIKMRTTSGLLFTLDAECTGVDCDRLRFVAEAPEANKTRKTFGLLFRRAASCRGVNLRLLSADMAAPFSSKSK